ncbi:AbrB family transcriptional regulator [Rhodococcus kroppenstedtii]|uniref:AbrB family transcriptional regulator n=1 Tax=Rhodococcoides kroppenstedtii TaxID=293050 RepID=UPI002953C62D|nr:AbrB family transcriptional regulator [Rhodococcus kroppenstedtii]MDV7196262.1 AbrB family transcriptional regulator [Rhodococcus kroppenstedtii]
MRFSPAAAGRWVALTLVTILLTILAERVGVPSAALFVGLAVATVFALAKVGPAKVPSRASQAAQAVLGVEIGTLLDRDILASLGTDWIPVVLVSLGTLLLSIGAGAALGLHRDLSATTGALALVAGGASGMVAIARDLGGDERVVAVVQYLRVLLVTASLPFVATVVFHADTGRGVGPADSGAPLWVDAVFILGCLAVGVPLARLIRLPAPALLGPLIVATVADLAGWTGGAEVPTLLLAAVYVVIGWQAGLRFTVESFRSIGRILPWATLLIVAIAVGCALLGLILVATTSVTPYEAYLATTPGGIYAVLALAAASDVNVTFVVAAQVLRVFLMLLIVPLFTRRRQRGD